MSGGILVDDRFRWEVESQWVQLGNDIHIHDRVPVGGGVPMGDRVPVDDGISVSDGDLNG